MRCQPLPNRFHTGTGAVCHDQRYGDGIGDQLSDLEHSGSLDADLVPDQTGKSGSKSPGLQSQPDGEINMPDTMNYLILGLVVLAFITVVYLGSMIVRYRNYQNDLKVIEELQEDSR